jgi:hypothetical protein
MTTVTDDYDPASWLSMAATLGVEVETVTDTFGRVDVRLDRTAMRAFRDAALAHGFADIAGVFSKAISPAGRKS